VELEEKGEKNMRNCSCGGGMNMGGCNTRVETIVEPTVHCRTVKHHHKTVRHIVPVVYHQVNVHHKHHEYEIQRRYTQENTMRETGRRNEDWCKVGQQGGCGAVDVGCGCEEVCDCGC